MPNSSWRRLVLQIFVLLMNARVNVFTLSWDQPTGVDGDGDGNDDNDDDDDDDGANN